MYVFIFRKLKKDDSEYYSTLKKIDNTLDYAKNSALNYDVFIMAAAEDKGYDLNKYRQKILAERSKDSQNEEEESGNEPKARKESQGRVYGKIQKVCVMCDIILCIAFCTVILCFSSHISDTILIVCNMAQIVRNIKA